jgi:exonuclease SbcD
MSTVAHLSDIHYCAAHLDEIRACMDAAVAGVEQARPDAIVLSGDTFDRRLAQNEPAFLAALRDVTRLADIAPVIILQGTLSHDAPHSVDVFRTVRDIYVADRIEQRAIAGILWSFLPAVNKGNVAAAIGAESASSSVLELVGDVLAGFARRNAEVAAAGQPTVLVSHGTVTSAVTEHGVPMMGLDHEFTPGVLFAAGASAAMLGHIHKHQHWSNGRGQCIAYPGSLGRYHFGEMDPKGWLLWDVRASYAAFQFMPTPARELIDLEFAGPPDLGAIAKVAWQCKGAHVRVRWQVDEEHRHAVDRAAIERLLAGAAQVKLEGRINPVQRQRAAGIGAAVTLADRLARWCEITHTDAYPVLERLAALQSHTDDEIRRAL